MAFQQVAGIKDSGKLNKKTMEKMSLARCGNEDISPEIPSNRFKKRFTLVSKWLDKMDQNDVLHLKWFIEKYTNDIPVDDIRDVVKRAFKLWSSQTPIPAARLVKLDFAEAATDSDSDISIMWAEGDHGDAYPFDGPGNTTNILAHTFYPNYQETGTLNGDIHFDDYEKWVLDDAPVDGGVHFPYVLVHEIGHALGLGHSKRQEAVMNPIYKQTPLDTIQLDVDDKCAINWNYIGPSNTCLFVWLMVELLPRVKETNSTHGIAVQPSSNNPGLDPRDYAHHVGQIIDLRVNQTLDGFQSTKIPLCSEDNDVQSQYEDLLVKKLDFPRLSARRYGPVICNYLSGLSKVVNGRKRNAQSDATGDGSSLSDGAVNAASPSTVIVHSYSTGPYGALRYSQFHDTLQQQADDDWPLLTTEEEAKNAQTIFRKQNENKFFNGDYFDETFFKNILRLFMTKLPA